MTPLSNTCAHGKPMLGTFAVCPQCHPEVKENELWYTGVFDLCLKECRTHSAIPCKDLHDVAAEARLIVIRKGEERVRQMKVPGAWIREVARRTALKWIAQNNLVLLSPKAERGDRGSSLDFAVNHPAKVDGLSRWQTRKRNQDLEAGKEKIPKYAKLSKQKRRVRLTNRLRTDLARQALLEAIIALPDVDCQILLARTAWHDAPQTWETLADTLGLTVEQVRYRHRKAAELVQERICQALKTTLAELLFPTESKT